MKQKVLYLAKGLELPADAITEKMAFLGRTGSGKTYTAMKVAEEMLKINAQIVALDPVGKWHGLRTLKNGKKGFSIPVFGGLYGDLPLEAESGKLIADLIVDKNISAIIDVSQFETDREKTRFASDFSARLFFRKKGAPSPIHLFVEECQEFIPQNTQKGEEQMLHNFQRIWKLGRNFGIGGSLISQRPQEVNKKALNQTECMFAFQMTGPQEKDTIKDWIGKKGLEENISDILPSLQKGQCWLWSPVWLNCSTKIKVNEKDTMDISATPKLGTKLVKPQELSASEISQIKVAMADTIQRSKENDPIELKKQVIELKKQLNKKQVPVQTQVQVPVKNNSELISLKAQLKESERLRNEDMKVLNVVWQEFKRREDELFSILEEMKKGNEWVKNKINNPAVLKISLSANKIEMPESTNIKSKIVSERTVHANRRDNAPILHRSESNNLPKGEKAVLIACAQFPNGLYRNQITVLTQYKRSSRDAYIQRLKEKGLIGTSADKVIITENGVATLGDDYKPLPTGDELRTHWLNTLPQGEKVMLELISEVYPESITREQLTDKSSYQRSSRDAYLQRMLAKEIIEVTSRGEVRASDSLFG